MKILFCKSNTLTSSLIRLATFSQWSHVGIEHNGRVIDATMTNGVAETDLSSFTARYEKTRSIPAYVNTRTAWRFLQNQIGKPYDWPAIAALPFRENWQKDDKWFCSELAAAAMMAGGRKFNIKTGRITPRDLWVSL